MEQQPLMVADICGKERSVNDPNVESTWWSLLRSGMSHFCAVDH